MRRNVEFFVFFCVFLMKTIAAESTNDLNEKVEQTLTEERSQEESDSRIALKLNETDVPLMKQGEIWLREMCETNGDNDSYKGAQVALKNVWNCFDGVVEFSKLPRRIEEAKPKGCLDEVFEPFCRRAVELKRCVRTLLADMNPCLSVDQNASKLTAENITDALFKFACMKDGVHMALFVAEKGPQCISDKQPGIERCIRNGLNESKTHRAHEATLNRTNELPALSRVDEGGAEKSLSFSFELEPCRIAYKVRNCIVDELLQCSDTTPANVVESMFNMIQRTTTCSKYSRAELDPSYAAMNTAADDVAHSTVLSLILPAVTILSVCLMFSTP